MEGIITTVISAISPSALPIVICIIGIAYLYFKFGRVQKDREVTKAERDKDSQALHDDILKLKFKVSELDGKTVKHETVIEDMQQQLSELNTNIVRLSVVVEALAKKLDK